MLYKIFLLWALVFPISGFSFAYPYEKMEIVYAIEREPKSLKISVYKPMQNPDDRIFAASYWKIYYQKDKIVGEELYEKGNLTYYYVYYYDEAKIYQKGFFWYGIYRDIGVFKAHDKRIKQGFMYKNVPNSYRVFDRASEKLTYEYYYPLQENSRS